MEEDIPACGVMFHGTHENPGDMGLLPTGRLVAETLVFQDPLFVAPVYVNSSTKDDWKALAEAAQKARS